MGSNFYNTREDVVAANMSPPSGDEHLSHTTHRRPKLIITYTETENTASLASNLTIANDLKIEQGATLDVSGSDYDITIAGNWTNEGYFESQGGEVIFNGTNQLIEGNNNFNDFCKTTAVADRLYFASCKTQSIQGRLKLKGASGELLTICSDNEGDQWYINPDPDADGMTDLDLDFLDVKDSNNSSGTDIDATDKVARDSGNNDGWLFDCADERYLGRFGGSELEQPEQLVI